MSKEINKESREPPMVFEAHRAKGRGGSVCGNLGAAYEPSGRRTEEKELYELQDRRRCGP